MTRKLQILFTVLALVFVSLVDYSNTQTVYSMPGDAPFYVKNIVADTSMRFKRNVISGLGATRTLTALESGSTVLLDRAAGIVLTLPAPSPGLWYDIKTTVTVTSNAYKFSTGTQGTDFFNGGVVNVDTDTSNAVAVHTCDGSTHDNVSMNGTTTGGLIGSNFRLTAITATLWLIEGMNQANGTVATACATS